MFRLWLIATLLLMNSAVFAAKSPSDDEDLLGLDEPKKEEEPAPAPEADTSAPPAASSNEEIKPPGDDKEENVDKTTKAAPAEEKKKPLDLTEKDQNIQDRVKAVPRKAVIKRGRLEIGANASLSLNDPYYQHVAFSGNAMFFPHDSFGLGLGADYLYGHFKSDNVDVVRRSFTSVPAVFEKPRLFAHADFQWVPIYGKISVFNTEIVHFDVYAVTGVGLATAFGSRTPWLVHAGLGQRFFINDWIAVRLEARDYLFVDTLEVNGQERSDVQSYVMVHGGLSIFVPPSFEYQY